MSDKSAIEWTDASWTPIRARNKATGKLGWFCTHKSAGCTNCYAERLNRRLGTGLPFEPKHLKDVELFLDKSMLGAPLRWRTPRRIFVCSMTDLFAEFVPDEWIDRVFGVMAEASGHTFQVLTKRPSRALEWFDRINGLGLGYDGKAKERGAKLIGSKEHPWPLPNVWLGVSVEDQATADERIPLLLQTPAAVRFVSYEPALGPVDLQATLWSQVPEDVAMRFARRHDETTDVLKPVFGLNWVIVGGESGPGARPFDLAWARTVIAQCKAAGMPVFVKQLGRYPHDPTMSGGDERWIGLMRRLEDRKGGDPSEWPEDLRVREFPDAIKKGQVA